MVIRDTSTMDRPVVRPRRSRLMWSAAAAAAVIVVVLAWPVVGRWFSADRSVARDRLRFGRAVIGDLEHLVAVEGRVVAASRPTLFSPADGIVSVKVAEGQKVEAASVLAVVESPGLESRLRQERATADALASEGNRLELEARQGDLENEQSVELGEVRQAAAARLVERNEHLFELGLVNQIDLEAARDNLRIATLELQQARQRLELERDMRKFEISDASHRLQRQRLVVTELERQVGDLEVVAPFDGLVATLSVEDRDAVVQGQALIGVVDLSDLEVEVGIPENAADQVTPGVPAAMTIDGVEYGGAVTRVAPEVRNGQVVGRVAFAGGVPPGLRQNQRVATRLLLDRRDDVLKVPRGPFLESGGGRSVYVVEDGLARRREIEVGAISVAEVEVVGGLVEGDEIVLSDMSQFDGVEKVLIRE
jgi:HlyD family secretion protein